MAAPRPERKPDARPSDSVRRMQRMPIGPTGAAMENPMMSPFIKRLKSRKTYLHGFFLIYRASFLRSSQLGIPLGLPYPSFLMLLSRDLANSSTYTNPVGPGS